MRDSTFITAIKFRLGLVQHAGTENCGVCRHAQNDCFGNHAVTCGTSGDRIIRHDLLAKEVHRSCRSALFTAQLEQGNLMEGGYRPGDIYVENWFNGLAAALHISVPHPAAFTYYKAAAKKTMLQPQSVKLASSRNMKRLWL
jgi:hypothetical protein